MLIYVIFMAAIAVFLYKESIKLLKDESTLLKEFCTDPVAKKTALSLMRKVLLSAIFSAGLMHAKAPGCHFHSLLYGRIYLRRNQG